MSIVLELAVQLVRQEQELAQIEKTLVQRGRELARTLSKHEGEKPMATLQSMTAARSPTDFALPTLSPSLDARAIQVPPEGDAALQLASAALGRAQKAAHDMISTCAAILANEVMTVPARHVEMFKASEKISKLGLQEIDKAHTHLCTEIEALTRRTYAPPPPADLRAELRH